MNSIREPHREGVAQDAANMTPEQAGQAFTVRPNIPASPSDDALLSKRHMRKALQIETFSGVSIELERVRPMCASFVGNHL